MKKIIFILIFSCSFYVPSVHSAWDDFLDVFKEQFSSDETKSSSVLSNPEIVSGLKEALLKGSETAISSLGQADGFLANPKVKIPMPEKLQTVESMLRKLKQDEIADQFVLSMNRAAEQAVPKATSIVTNIVKSMSIEDAYGVLKGHDTAATDYLRDKGSTELHHQFLPIVKQATSSVGVTDKYKSLLSNLGPASNFIDVESLDLDKYVTDKALEGLFTLVAEEEKLIRTNPAARTTELLKKVFSN